MSRLQEIIDYVEAARQELLESVTGLGQAELDLRPAPERWSVGEILHHLHLIEGGVSRLLAKMIDRAERAGAAPDKGGESVLHSLDGFSIETVTVKIAAPQSVAPARGLGRDELQQLLGASRGELRECLGRAAAFDLSRLRFPHPVLGRLDTYQWILYLGKHETRHRLQIEDVKHAILGR